MGAKQNITDHAGRIVPVLVLVVTALLAACAMPPNPQASPRSAPLQATSAPQAAAVLQMDATPTLPAPLTNVSQAAVALQANGTPTVPAPPSVLATRTRRPTRTPTVTRTPTTTPRPFVARPTPVPGAVGLDLIAPPGEARDLLMMNCSNCHPAVCALRDRLTFEHWRLVRRSHDYYNILWDSDKDIDLIFAYLEDNFNDRQPPIQLPPELSGQSCGTDV